MELRNCPRWGEIGLRTFVAVPASEKNRMRTRRNYKIKFHKWTSINHCKRVRPEQMWDLMILLARNITDDSYQELKKQIEGCNKDG